MNIKLIEKLWERTELKDSHWLWKGTVTGGQGQVVYNQKRLVVSRLSLCIYLKLGYKGEWLACHIDSLCREPLCWNPLHLYKGSYQTNNNDTVKYGSNINAVKYYCRNGHGFTTENTYIDSRGFRQCRECRKFAQRDYYKRRANRETALP